MIRRLLCAVAALLISVPAVAQIDPAARGLAAKALTQNADPRIRSAGSSLRQIGNRVGIFNQKSGSNVRAGFRTWEVNYTSAQPIVCFWNGFTNSALSGVETGTGGVMNMRLYIEYAGTTTPLTWGGAATSAIPSNSIGCTDPAPITVPAFAKYRLCGDMQMGSGGTVPSSGWSNAADTGGGDEYQTGTTSDYCASGTALAKTAATAVYPVLVLGQSDRTVWAAVGDSIVAGVNYLQPQISGGRGILAAMAEGAPILNYGVPGDRAAWYVANSTVRRQLIATGGAIAAVLELGINDVTSGRTSAQVLADRATIRALLPGLAMYETTLMPTASSSDSPAFKTTAGQTEAGSSAQRKAFNNALRGGVAGVAGVLDFAAEVETSTATPQGTSLDGGVWLPECMVGGDGTHPSEQCERQRIAPLLRALQATRR